jgi:hypothetical protein
MPAVAAPAGLGLSRRPASSEPLPACERPVFFDGTGRRARLVRWAGRLLAAIMPTWLFAVIVGMLTPLQLPALPVSLASTHAVPIHVHHLTHAPPSVAELSEHAS